MTFKTLMMTAAATSLLTGTAALAADDAQNAETLNRQNPQAVEGAPEGTTYDANAVETDPALQQGENVDRQNPQMIDPVEFDKAGLSPEAKETYTRISQSQDKMIVLSDGTVLGKITGLDIDNAGHAEVRVELSDAFVDVAKMMVVTTGPENVSFTGDDISLAVSGDEMSVLAQDGSDDDTLDTATVFLN